MIFWKVFYFFNIITHTQNSRPAWTGGREL